LTTLLSIIGYNRSQQQHQQQQNTGNKNTSTGNYANEVPQKYYNSDGNNSQLRHFQTHPSPSFVPSSSSSSSSLMMPRRLPGFSNNPSSTVIATVQPIQPLSSASMSINSKYNRLDNNNYNRVTTMSTPVVVTVKRNPSPASHRIVKKKIYL
jgi:hypothetical protein